MTFQLIHSHWVIISPNLTLLCPFLQKMGSELSLSMLSILLDVSASKTMLQSPTNCIKCRQSKIQHSVTWFTKLGYILWVSNLRCLFPYWQFYNVLQATSRGQMSIPLSFRFCSCAKRTQWVLFVQFAAQQKKR